MSGITRAVFIDRDGVINRDSPDFIKSWDEVDFLPGSRRAIRELTAAGYAVIVVTNQSGVGRGLLTLETLAEIHRRMRAAVREAGGDIRDIRFCPHRPGDGCDCRKPLPGLILSAARDHGIDPSRAWMVGDSVRDIRCGQTAGCRTVLVRTGNGRDAERTLAEEGAPPAHVAESLPEAAEYIILSAEC